MSIEDFRQRFPADESLRPAIENYKDQHSLYNSSRIGLLARAFTGDASSGLRDLMRGFREANATLKPADISHLTVLPDTQAQIELHHAGIVFGVSLSSIEDTMVVGVFDCRLFIETYNTAIVGTAFVSGIVQGEDIYALTKQQLDGMYACAKLDKTLCLFFQKEGIDAMPRPLGKFLSTAFALPVIRRRIIPVFHERAQLLTAS